MTYILEGLTHKIEGQPPKKEVSWVLGKGKVPCRSVWGCLLLTQNLLPGCREKNRQATTAMIGASCFRPYQGEGFGSNNKIVLSDAMICAMV